MAYDVTSQWDDIHRKLGNYEELPVEKKQSEYTQEALEALENYDPFKHKTAEELEDMEDEFGEDEFMEKYRAQRLQEMQGTKEKKPTFEGVREITRQDYVDEVTNADKGTYVILHLYQNSVTNCEILNRSLSECSVKYPHLKFLKIVASKCIENYPDKNCPTIVIYLNGKMVTTMPQIDKRYSKLTVAAVENMLQGLNILPKVDTKDKETIDNYKSKRTS